MEKWEGFSRQGQVGRLSFQGLANAYAQLNPIMNLFPPAPTLVVVAGFGAAGDGDLGA